MANICDEARRAMLMPYLAVRLIMPLSCDKSNDGKGCEEHRGRATGILFVYFRQRATLRGRKKVRKTWDGGEFVIYGFVGPRANPEYPDNYHPSTFLGYLPWVASSLSGIFVMPSS